MEAWAFIFWLGNSHPARKVSVQNEDACVLLAKAVPKSLPVDGMCVNEFDGRVFWFEKGRQVER